MSVQRRVRPAKMILSTDEFLAMSQPEVETWYETCAPSEPDRDPRYWANVATLSQRKLRSHIERQRAWLIQLAAVLAVVVTALLVCVILLLTAP